MRQKLKGLIKDEYFFHSAVVFIGNLCVGGVSLLYTLLAVRLLSPEDYGIFNTLVSLVMLGVMAITPLDMTFTRFFSEHAAKKDFDAFRTLLQKIIYRLLVVAGVILIGAFVVSHELASFLKTEMYYIMICGGIIAASFRKLTNQLKK
ncbi:lipopolysaccharide biosynthesis protein [Candidatus Auribacterota bacterium]